MVFDLESLRLIWWVLLGVVLLGMVLCEGLTLGATLLLPVLAETDEDWRRLIARIVPGSLGSLAWLVVLVVIVFAAWPVLYAVAMASFYPLLLPVLLVLLLRPLVLYFLEACEHAQCRQYGHRVLAAGGLVPAALFGILVGNVIKGIPFHLESDMQIRFLGDFFGLFNLFSMLVAATCLALLAMHGALFLQLKTVDSLRERAKAMAVRAALLFLILFAVSGLWITHLEGYHITSDILPNDASNPLAKFVKRGEGLWLDNYEHEPALWAIPALAFIGAITALWLARRDKAYWAMLAGSLCVVMVVLTFGISMFPFLLPSNISLNSSLAIWDSSASRPSLRVLLWVAVFAVPSMAVISRWLYCGAADDKAAVADSRP